MQCNAQVCTACSTYSNAQVMAVTATDIETLSPGETGGLWWDEGSTVRPTQGLFTPDSGHCPPCRTRRYLVVTAPL